MNDLWMWLALAAAVAAVVGVVARRQARRAPLLDDASAPTPPSPAAPSDAVAEATALAQHMAEQQALLDDELAAEHAALLATYRQAEEASLQRERQARAAAEAEAAREAARESERRAAEAAARHDAERRAAEAARQEAERQAVAARERAEREERAERAAREAAAAAAREAAREAAERAAIEAARAAAQRQAALATAPVASPPRTPEQTLVMVADDSKVVRVKASRLLAAHQYRVALAEDGEAALRLIEAEMPQLLITDVEMPGVDGFELTRRVRGNARTAQLPIIMITSADDRLRDAAAEAGVSVLLGKPYVEDELLAQIARLANVTTTAAA
jgi:CheY-like chemotaxis protein